MNYDSPPLEFISHLRCHTTVDLLTMIAAEDLKPKVSTTILLYFLYHHVPFIFGIFSRLKCLKLCLNVWKLINLFTLLLLHLVIFSSINAHGSSSCTQLDNMLLIGLHNKKRPDENIIYDFETDRTENVQ